MNLDAEIAKWLALNWPSLITGLVAASVYVRLSRFVNRLTRIEHTVDLIREIHAERHPEHAARLYREDKDV